MSRIRLFILANIPISDELRGIVKNSFFTMIVQGVNFLVPIITLPILLRVLGSTAFGFYSIAGSVVQYCVIITDFGFAYTATRKASWYREINGPICSLFSTVVLIKTGLGVISFALMLACLYLVREWSPYSNVFYALYLLVLSSIVSQAWIFQGFEEMRFIAIFNAVSKLPYLGSILVFLRPGSGPIFAAEIQGTAGLVGSILSIIVATRRYSIRLVVPSRTEVLEQLTEGLNVFASTFFGNIYGQGAVVVTGLTGGLSPPPIIV